MFKYLWLFLLISCASSLSENVPRTGLINWDEPISEKLFNRSIKKDFFKLANHFETQSNRVYCGPTSATIVLNALRDGKNHELPIDSTVLLQEEQQYLPKDFNASYPKYTQRNVFELKNSKVKTKLEVLGKPTQQGKKDFGFQIRQYADFLQAHGLSVELNIVDKKANLETLKNKIIQNLSEPNNYVIINYKRTGLGQKGGGHISPLGAYDPKSDRFLIMDVYTNNYTWVWVTSGDLFKAMQTFDTLENRGFVLVSE